MWERYDSLITETTIFRGNRDIKQGRVVRKPINPNPGLKVKRSIYFSCVKPFFTADVLCSLSLVKFKTEGRTV